MHYVSLLLFCYWVMLLWHIARSSRWSSCEIRCNHRTLIDRGHGRSWDRNVRNETINQTLTVTLPSTCYVMLCVWSVVKHYQCAYTLRKMYVAINFQKWDEPWTYRLRYRSALLKISALFDISRCVASRWTVTCRHVRYSCEFHNTPSSLSVCLRPWKP